MTPLLARHGFARTLHTVHDGTDDKHAPLRSDSSFNRFSSETPTMRETELRKYTWSSPNDGDVVGEVR